MRQFNRALVNGVAACGLAVSSAGALTVVHVDATVVGGVGDMCDECPTTLPGLAVGATGCGASTPHDLDGDVDQSDFGRFQGCLRQNPATNEACAQSDFNRDQLINRNDRKIFMNCFSGPNVPADPGCYDWD